ncbi:hypothetical protein [Xenophilus sp. Marseille-Q4582]|uniref:hypothetical protein n=1 Tax=Xenophilus sp. Marseille-Q4582 TaxID=2866600 RepID=UPI001CE4021E|nr:hypothetical protein [Xenophilus sp. Marseille-Q4582]
MLTALIFCAWLISIGDSNKSTTLCVILFVALVGSCTSKPTDAAELSGVPSAHRIERIPNGPA